MDYQKDSDLLVYDLINRDNPHLPVPITPLNARLGVPKAVTTDNFRNTVISVTGLDGNFSGVTELTYRRLDINSLLPKRRHANNVTVGTAVLNHWAASSITDRLVVQELVNTATGLKLRNGVDFNMPVPLVTTDGNYYSSGAALASSKSFIGSFFILFEDVRKPLNVQLPGSGFSLISPYADVPADTDYEAFGGLATFGHDFSRFAASINLNSFTLSARPQGFELANLIKHLSNLNCSVSDLLACTGTRYALNATTGNVNVPTANYLKYQFVTVLSSPAGAAFKGLIYLHYSPR